MSSQLDPVYVCPRCKESLLEFRCPSCALEFPVHDGIPCFLSGSADAPQGARRIYDQIYSHHEDVWVDQGRDEPFLAYFGALASSISRGRILEVGCGEGALLAHLQGSVKFGIDPSINALRRAMRRSAARCAVAQAERLPFPSSSFELVVSVGVMEHFEDPDAATADIRRVLVTSGCYMALIHTDMTLIERLKLKVREFIFPRFRPRALVRWILKKANHPIVQPLRRSYTIDTAKDCLERNGFALERTITRKTDPEAPLAGGHVVILIARKSPT